MATESTGQPTPEDDGKPKLTDAEKQKADDARRSRWHSRVIMLLGVLLIALSAVLVKAEIDANNSNEDLAALTKQVQDTTHQVKQSQKCSIKFSAALSDALQPRDSIGQVSIAAAQELWREFRQFVKDPPEATTQDEVLQVIDNYLLAIDRLKSVGQKNPYPTLEPCLKRVTDGASKEDSQAILRLISSTVVGQGFPGNWDNKCLHKKVTIRGNDRDNNISGTNGRDVIFAYSGNDIVNGNGGRDRICGRFGGDTLSGGDGFDRINGGNGGGIDLCFAERTKKCP